MSEIINVPMAAQRDISDIAKEIRFYVARGMEAAIEIGRRLVEAKAMLNHGEWGAWLSEEVNISASNAQIYMSVFKEYGDGQQSLYGNAGDQLAKIPNLTMAHELLAIKDKAERAEFIESHDLSEMSTRELKQAIRDRDEAQEAQRAAEETAEALRVRIEEAERSAAGAKEEQEKAREERQKAIEERDKAKAAAKKAKDELKALKNNPTIPEGVMAAMRKEAEEKAASELEQKWKAKAEEADKRAREAAEREQREKEEVQRLQAKLAMAAPEMAVFASLFGTIQEDWKKVQKCARDIKENQPEMVEKIKKAAMAALDQFRMQAEAW